MLKLVLSRKGFDSGSGGCPSPVLPDGRLVSLPIPDKGAPHAYTDITWAPGRHLGELIRDLAPARVKPTHRAHLDPDLLESSVPRARDWRPIFGQVGASQSHLANEGVGAGDVFVFFGLFRRTEYREGRFRFVPRARPVHLLFGWLQVERVYAVDDNRPQLEWAHDHPHLCRPSNPRNVVYVARSTLDMPGVAPTTPGAGVFTQYSESLQLTAPDSATGVWQLPAWFAPLRERPALTYHGDRSRWSLDGDMVRLRTVGRGQEFVLDVSNRPEAGEWLGRLTHAPEFSGTP